MEKDLITIHNIKLLKENIKLLNTLAKQYQSNYPKQKHIEQLINQYEHQIIKEKDQHNHNFILYLGEKNQKETYFCPICESYLINPSSDQIQDKKILDVTPFVTASVSEHDISSYIRKVILRYHKNFTKIIIEDIYQYLQNNLKDSLKGNQPKRNYK